MRERDGQSRRWVTIARLAAVGVAAALSIASLVRRAATLPPARIDLPGAPSDGVLQSDLRWTPVRNELIRQGAEGRVGYFQAEPVALMATTPHGIENYFHAQFSLTPFVLEVDGHPRWIVAEGPVGAQRVGPGWTLLHEFGGGLMLLRSDR